MPQSKRQKQGKALRNLESRLQVERESRQALQLQTVSYYLIPPSDEELRLAQEVNNIKRVMGLDFQNEPSPF